MIKKTYENFGFLLGLDEIVYYIESELRSDEEWRKDNDPNDPKVIAKKHNLNVDDCLYFTYDPYDGDISCEDDSTEAEERIEDVCDAFEFSVVMANLLPKEVIYDFALLQELDHGDVSVNDLKKIYQNVSSDEKDDFLKLLIELIEGE